MRTEYKRDMNHNYLVLHGEEELDTSSYQIRMLVGNVIPSLLKCRIQGMDGNFVIYYDITSRQSLTAFYEDRKLGQEDIKLIFGEFIRVMEDAAEYLINPGQLMFSPDYMFLEIEKKEICFCLMPGYQKEVKEQFQTLTEYILPRIDHSDEKAVMIGYGVYRRALEDIFHLEHIKEELYKVREIEEKEPQQFAKGTFEPEKIMDEPIQTDAGEFLPEEDFFSRRENYRKERREKKQKKASALKTFLGFGTAALALTGIIAAKALGYLPDVGVEVIVGSVIVCMGFGMLIYSIIKKRKKKAEMKTIRL